MSSQILTVDQAIMIFIQSLVFMVLYYVYNNMFGSKAPITYIVLITSIFLAWLLSITIFSNFSLAMSVPIARTSNIPDN